MAGTKITLKDVYDAVTRVENRIIRRLESIEKDVKTNTAYRNRSVGIVAGVSAITAVVINILTRVL